MEALLLVLWNVDGVIDDVSQIDERLLTPAITGTWHRFECVSEC
jgi:hypothetical protein